MDPAFLRYIPKNKSSSDCANLAAGIILGILEASGFTCKIEVQTPPEDGESKYPATAFVIDFDLSVIEREKNMKKWKIMNLWRNIICKNKKLIFFF